MAGSLNTKLAASAGPNDMRIKLNNSLAKKSDARQMIQARKQAKQQAAGQKARVSGLGSPGQPRSNSSGSVSMAESGSLVRTVPGNQGGGSNLFNKTVSWSF